MEKLNPGELTCIHQRKSKPYMPLRFGQIFSIASIHPFKRTELT